MKKIISALIAVAMILSSMGMVAFAAGDSIEANAEAKIEDQYYSTVAKALEDATTGDFKNEDEVTIIVLKTVVNLPEPKRTGLIFKSVDENVKVTGRANLPHRGRTPDITNGKITWDGFDFTEMTDWAFCPWDANDLTGLEFEIKNCKFRNKAFGAWESSDKYNFKKLTIDNCKFFSDSTDQLISIQHGEETIINNCDFTGCTTVTSAVNMAGKSKNLTATNNEFGNRYIQLSQNLGDYERSTTIANNTFSGEYAIRLHSNLGYNYDANDGSSTIYSELIFAENIIGDDTAVAYVQADNFLQENKSSIAMVENETESGAAVTEIAPGVTVSKAIKNETTGNYYISITDAIAAAENGAEINLNGNIVVIDVYQDSFHAGKSLTFKNGTMDFSYAGAPTALFWLSGSQALAFEDMKIIKRDVGTERKYMYNLIQVASPNAQVSFTKCEIDLDGGYDATNNVGMASSYIANDGNGKIFFTNCDIENEYTNLVYRGGVIFDTCTYDGYANLDEGDTSGNIIHWAANPCVIKNSKVNTRTLGFISSNGTIDIIENSVVEAANVRHYYGSTSSNYSGELLTVDATSSLVADKLDANLIDKANSAGTIVNNTYIINVEFVKADVDAAGNDNDEDSDLYNINLVQASGNDINRLNSVDLTFALTQGDWGKNIYEIIDSSNEISINEVSEGRYEFHYDGKDGVITDTAAIITIGQVEITGYGEYTFAVDTAANTTNVAHATTLADNIVDTFLPEGDTLAGEGVLDLSNAEIKDEEITVPTRDLVIKLAFNNSVKRNAVDYQQMKVIISGGDLANEIVIPVMTGGIDTKHYDITGEAGKADAEYYYNHLTSETANDVIIENALTVNTTYNVKVEGAGYRDAYYTVTMNEDVQSKTLNFWNNVKDVAEVVEEGKDTSKKNVTFLAGDIVKDNIINIYDLSAVVSYFGEVELQDNNTGYAKYDLNRDGKIDSKDVAYVLVSWGK